MRRSSLSRQLIAGVLLAELACAALFAGVAVLHEMRGRRHAFDVMLRGRADSLLGAIHDAEDPQDSVTVDPNELRVPARDLYEVLDPSGRVLGASPNTPLPLFAALSAAPAPGYFDLVAGRVRYRGIRFDGVRVIDRDDVAGGLRRPVVIFYASPTRDLWHEAVEAVQFYIVAGVLLLALTDIALVWFLRRRLSPLEELAAIAGRVSTRSWDFVPPDAVLRTAELAPIALSIEKLLDGLHQAFERQRRLTGDAAHELKTSIAVLKSSLQLLAMNPRTAEQYREGLDGLISDTERMEQLALRMLSLARLEEAPIDPAAQSSLAAALHAVADRLRSVAQQKEIALSIETGELAEVRLPSDDAETLCSNLVMNALQHTPQGGRVTASVVTQVGVAVFKVADSGEGIPADALPHVFERFYRADSSRARSSGGAGLGLSICRAIAERAGGSIAIDSAPGAGTAVTVTLPLAACQSLGAEDPQPATASIVG